MSVEAYYYDPQSEPDYDTFEDSNEVLDALINTTLSQLYRKESSPEIDRRIEDILRFKRDMCILPCNY